MPVCQRLDGRAAVADVYDRRRAGLAARLGGTPAPETERLYKILAGD